MYRTMAAIAALLVCLSFKAKAEIQPHPDGCPRVRFCGCGVSVKVFGKPIRNLFLAAAWKRFQPASPAPGMVAWRYGHVFYIMQVIDKRTVLAYDPNSGGHKTRIHQKSLAGYRVVNPRAGRMASLE